MVSLFRANWVAFLATFLWASVGAFAGDRCVCDDLMASCEHAGTACAQEDDCSDCFKSAPLLADEVVGLVPPANPQVFLPPYAGMSQGVRLFSPDALICFEMTGSFRPLRPPALRVGTMCLRV